MHTWEEEWYQKLDTTINIQDIYLPCGQGCNVGGDKGAQFPRCQMTAGAPKIPNNVTSTLFNTVHLLPKDLKFKYGDDKPALRCSFSVIWPISPIRKLGLSLTLTVFGI